jgi:hypothetical protein
VEHGEGKSEALLGQLVRANPQESCTRPRRFRRKFDLAQSTQFTLDDTFPPDYIEQRVQRV